MTTLFRALAGIAAAAGTLLAMATTQVVVLTPSAYAQEAVASLSALPDGSHHLGSVDPEDAGYALLLDKSGERVRGVEYDRAGYWFACFDVALGADGLSGTGLYATVGKDGAIEPQRDATVRFDAAGPLASLPAALAQENLADGEVAAFRVRCLATLGSG